jgi:hypothetical protein
MRGQGIRIVQAGEDVQIFGEDGPIEAAREACQEILGLEPETAPLTDEEITSLYEQSLEAATCLEGWGYSISEPPSLEDYIETYRLSMGSGGPPPWLPHGEVQGGLAQCPQPTLG